MALGFFEGAAQLALAGLVSRLLGLYRLLLPGILGPEGVGLYHMAYPIYSAMLAISTGGLPVAVSKLVADASAAGWHTAARRVLRLSALLLLGLGLLGCVSLIALAPWLAGEVIRDPRAALSLIGIAPALFVVSGMAALRGYFQGYQVMWPTALSQVVEQAARVAAILLLVVWLEPRGVAWQAAGAASGATFGAIFGLGTLLAANRRVALPKGGDRGPSGGRILRQLVWIALPITIATLGVPLMQLGDLFLVPLRLQQIGIGEHIRAGLYGELSGYAMPITALPQIVTSALMVALVPAVASATAAGNRALAAQRVRDGLRIAILTLLPAAAGIYALAPEIMRLLFGTTAPGATLEALAPGVLLFGVSQVAAAGLQGAGYTWVPLRNLLYAALLKFAGNWVLVGIFGIVGAGWATTLAYGLLAALNVFSLRRIGRLDMRIGDTLRPLLATGLMTLLVLAVPMQGRMSGLIAVAVGAAGYLVALIAVGGLSYSDLQRIPRIGPKLADALLWLRLIRRD